MCGIGGSKYLKNEMLKSVAPEDITPDPSRLYIHIYLYVCVCVCERERVV